MKDSLKKDFNLGMGLSMTKMKKNQFLKGIFAYNEYDKNL